MEKNHETDYDEKDKMDESMVTRQINDAYHSGVIEDMMPEEDFQSIRAKAAAIGSQ